MTDARSPAVFVARRRRWRAVVVVAMTLTMVASACGTKQSALLLREPAGESAGNVVKVGFVVLDTSSLAKNLGITFAPTGDLSKQIEALTDEVNRMGGLAGRPMKAVIRVYDAFGDSAPKEEELCKAFTQDDGVDAVVLQGQLFPNARPCYVAAKKIILDTTAYPTDQATFEELAPYFWQPSYPEYGAVLAALVRDLDRAGFFTKAKLGVVGIDSPVNRRVWQRDIQPALEGLGIDVGPEELRWVDQTSSASLQAGQDAATIRFKSTGVDRVLVIGGNRLAAYLMNTFKAQSYRPRFALTTWDSPEFNIRNYPEAMVGAIGISVNPGQDDVSEKDLPFPTGPGEQRCVDVLAKVGERFEARINARQTVLYCDAIFLLRDGLANASAPTAEQFATGVSKLGASGFVPAGSYSTKWGADVFAGVNGFRRFAFEADCSCMRLRSDVTLFEAP